MWAWMMAAESGGGSQVSVPADLQAVENTFQAIRERIQDTDLYKQCGGRQ
jgi:hypothetical protein